MTINERFKLVREQLGLTTRSFGASINMSGGAITNMEKGSRNITDRTISDVCREFNVNYDWLVYGDGEMFNQTDRRAYAIIDEILNGQNEFAKQVFMSFANFDKRDWQTLEKLIDNIISMREKDKKNQEPEK